MNIVIEHQLDKTRIVGYEGRNSRLVFLIEKKNQLNIF